MPAKKKTVKEKKESPKKKANVIKITKKKSASIGKKHSCIRCNTKFYDFGQEPVICPKCGTDQSDKTVVAKRKTKSSQL